MEITPPFGYKKLVPLQRDARVRPNQGKLPDFVQTANCIPILAGEAGVAGHDYPLMFVRYNERDYSLLTILGLSDGENLLVGPDGWAPFSYVPLHVRRHPYCMTAIRVEGQPQGQIVVCVEEEALSPDGVSPFDEAGNPTENWKQILQFLQQFEVEAQRSRELFALLADFKLFEETVARVQTPAGEFQLGGLSRIDEKRLDNLTSAQLKVLIKKGGMALIYQHLASLVRFDRLGYLKGERARLAGANADAATEAVANPTAPAGAEAA